MEKLPEAVRVLVQDGEGVLACFGLVLRMAGAQRLGENPQNGYERALAISSSVPA